MPDSSTRLALADASRPEPGHGLFRWLFLLFVFLVGTQVWAATPMVLSGRSHTCAVLASGAVQCWGINNIGQLGNGSTTNSSTPVSVIDNGNINAIAVSAGDDHTCAVLASGTVQCWGYNGSGNLGNGSTMSSSTPVSVTGISNATAVSVGNYHTCAVQIGRASCRERV